MSPPSIKFRAPAEFLALLLLGIAPVASLQAEPNLNWIFVSATGVPITASGQTRPLYVYLTSPGDIYLDDIRVVPGSNPATGVNVLTNGDFETGSLTPWVIGSAGNNSGSSISTDLPRSGLRSLHIVASAGGTTQNSSIWQNFSSALTPGATYTLSFWYRQTTNVNGSLIVRFSSNGIATTNNPAPLAVQALNPPAGAAVSNLTQIQVAFNKNASGVTASDLLIAGEPATWVSGSGSNYVFGFTQPAAGLVHVEWDSDNGIEDAVNKSPFSAPDAWEYTLINTNSPTIASTIPAADATVASLSKARVNFSKKVTGVTASLLLINGTPATGLTGSGSGPYIFEFAEPARGLATFSWSASQNIIDSSSNLFDGKGWSVALDPPAAAAALTNIVLNEVLARNTATNGLRDEDGLLQGWIEIYNRGEVPVSLAGWSLTDDPAKLSKWTFPPLLISGRQYLVLFTSGNDRRVPGTALHTNFKLSASGDYLGLFNGEFEPQKAAEFSPAYPEQRDNVSYGLDPANALRYFVNTTPGASNGFSSITGVVARLNASIPSGYFSSPFTVALTSSAPNVVVVYTTNGSAPVFGGGTTNGIIYSGPIHISRTTPLRAAGFATNLLQTPTLARTYLFSEDIIRQPNNPSGYPTGNVWTATPGTVQNGSKSYYQMDPAVVNDPLYSSDVRSGLFSIPTMSLILPIPDLFDPVTGIYTHPLSRGDAWERACSMELIFPDGSTTNTSIDCGLQIQGGSQREPAKNAKHSFRVTFKRTYGPGKLNFPMYVDSPVRTFNTLVIDGGINYWWHYVGSSSPADQRYRAQGVRDQFTSDLMHTLGHPAYHGRFFHLYLNGLYWGIQYVHERPDEDFAASYLGAASTDYDVIKNTSDGTLVVAGDLSAWNTALSIASSSVTNNAQYEQLQQYVDVDNLIDYMIVNHWVGNDDWPHHNWYVIRKRAPGEGFKFIVWDAEHVMKNVNVNRTTATTAGTPSAIYTALRNNPEFRLRFADRVQKHWSPGGVFYVDPANPLPDFAHPERNPAAALYMKRITEITNAIVAEGARWGGYYGQVTTSTGTNYTRNDQWLKELNNLLGYTNSPGNTADFFPRRSAVVLGQYKSIALVPGINAPVFSKTGGTIPAGFELSMTNQNVSGTIYFTTNGADPRVYATGSVSSSALAYSNALTLKSSVKIRARVLAGQTWSALSEANFQLGGSEPYPLAQAGPYIMANWSASEPAATYPPYMLFYQIQNSSGDPRLLDEMDSVWTLPYNLTNRSRINGLGSEGFSFINTGNAQTNAGAGFLGAAVLSLSTLGQDNLRVTWTGGTVTANERVYGIRLQYRVGTDAPFLDVMDSSNNPVEYLRNPQSGHSTVIGPVSLPLETANQPYVQLRWKYYFGSGDSGARAELRVGNILLSSGHPVAQSLAFTKAPDMAQAGRPAGRMIVQVLGQNGALADAYGGIVGVSISGQPDGLSGTQAVIATNGIAIFDDLTFQQAGTWNLTASAAGLASALSQPIQVLSSSPQPHRLASGSFSLESWSPDAPAATYPSNLLFFQATADHPDPELSAAMESLWWLPYNLTTRSRINGLGPDGFSFINTDNPQDVPGSGFVGAAVLSLNTLGVDNVQVRWTGGTVLPNTQAYGIRLQYRIGDSGLFIDALDAQGNPVEYIRNSAAGHTQVLGPVTLPSTVTNQSYVELRWKYYRISGTSGPRAQLSVDEIKVSVAPPRPRFNQLTLKPSGVLIMSFESVAGVSYQLEFRANLTDSDWIPLGTPTPGNGGTLLLEDDLTDVPYRFYRLTALEE